MLRKLRFKSSSSRQVENIGLGLVGWARVQFGWTDDIANIANNNNNNTDVAAKEPLKPARELLESDRWR